jgi:UDP-2,3-diacylglucosamine hydrolase
MFCFCPWLFGLIPPFIAVGLANFYCHKSRSATGDSEENFLGEEKEWLLIYSKEMLKQQHFDFFVFGHRHLPIDYRLKDNSRYINLGEWMNFSTYAIFDGTDMEVRSYSGMEHKIYKNW